MIEEITDDVCSDAEYLKMKEKQIEVERVVTLHALAAFENSPNVNLEQEDVNSLERFIYSEKHLKDNISGVKFCAPSK